MGKKLQTFQYLKIKQMLKNDSLLGIGILAQQGSAKDKIALKEKLAGLGIKSIKVTNTALKKVLKKSIFKNKISLVAGSLVLVLIEKNTKFSLRKTIRNLEPEIFLLVLKLKNKFFPLYTKLKLRGGYVEKKTETIQNVTNITKKLTKSFYFNIKKK